LKKLRNLKDEQQPCTTICTYLNVNNRSLLQKNSIRTDLCYQDVLGRLRLDASLSVLCVTKVQIFTLDFVKYFMSRVHAHSVRC